MKYVNVNEIAAKWNLSERSVRNYCAHGKIPGVILDGKTWRIPEDAVKPVRKKRAEKIANDLLTRLKMEKEAGIPGGIYHKVQIELTYNSNHMEGSRLTHDQTRYIFETNTIGIQDEVVNVDDIVETRLVGLLVGTGGDHNDCGVRNIIISTRIDLHGAGKCHSMTDIHSFSFRTIMIGIDQYHFRKKLTLHQGKRGRRSHKSAAHYNYLSTVNTHNSDLLSFTLSLFQNQMPDVYTMDR